MGRSVHRNSKECVKVQTKQPLFPFRPSISCTNELKVVDLFSLATY